MATTRLTKNLTAEQQAFLAKRARLIGKWRYVGAAMLLLIFGFTVYLLVSTPLLINPFEVISRLEDDSLPQSTIVILAAMLPVMFGALLVVLLAIVLVMYAAIANEKKYAAIIEALRGSQD